MSLKGRSKSSKTIEVRSDVHDGSSTAVCSKEPYVSEIDTVIKPNKLQQVLNEAWYDCNDSMTKKADLLVINGEPMDGANKKQLGQQSWTTNIEDQMRDAEKLIKDIPHDKILFIRGSGYHVQVDGTNFEEVMANRMGAMRYKSYGGQGATDNYAFVECYGKMFNFSHHVGFNKWAAYRTTAIARELAGMHFEKDKLHSADVVVRSHVHYFVHVEFVNTHGVSTPAWKFPDSHLFRGGVAGTTPDIGSVEFIVEPNGEILVNKHIAKIDLKPLVRHI
tara:strand:- start:9967 stop:10797 length:831 start_codon:yes stop_codon:yes gene_type:complete